MSSEAASRASLELPGIQEKMLEAAAASAKPVVVVLENGRPLDLRWAAEHVPATLESCIPVRKAEMQLPTSSLAMSIRAGNCL